ncbi:hypothetical protein GCM10010124_26640 [Pilimelia terevasa]|uniref:Cytosine-specific methyltransferase n=1 Tax=Pilimelia terevasa TaxID=53372 RepID=A0A8J3BV51_9ACTN|nr:DNA (cytosine-5-)-methyltransferase [Pilimelia terevasa]GGK32525.1 hypothetical protein GCM10010124_26640 [Pilimelia terevasa]
MNALSVFAGIGGLDLGLERAGMTVVGQVEMDPFCRSVLSRHWPDVPRHDDVRTAPAWWASQERPDVDVVCGGFPCQPFSNAGNRQGVGDARWGWPWMADVVRVVRPRYVLVENVAALLTAGGAFGTVLADLAALGFDAQWSVLSACAVGAPHTRERLFVVAYPHREHGPVGLADPRQPPTRHRPQDAPGHHRPGAWPDPLHRPMETERTHGRVPDGLPDRLECARVRALGNAVVPQVAEHVGRLITAHALTCP